MMQIAGQKVVVARSPGAFTLRDTFRAEVIVLWFYDVLCGFLNGQHVRYCSMISVLDETVAEGQCIWGLWLA